jgi:hypothetical protein
MFILKTFDDLNFQPHAHAKDMGVQASITFDNGYSISVVANDEGGDCFYGNHPDTFEVAVFNQRGDFVPLQSYDDVLGWQDPMQVSKLMAQFQQDGLQHEKLLHKIRQDATRERDEKLKNRYE